MQIAVLRALLKAYQKKTYIRKHIYGYHAEAIKVSAYLDAYCIQSDSYELTPTDVFRLFNILPDDSSLHLIKMIKMHFNFTPQFTSIFRALEHARLASESNFIAVYMCESAHPLLQDLFFCVDTRPVRLTQARLDAVLALSSSQPYHLDDVRGCVRLLNQRNLLNESALTLLQLQPMHTFSILFSLLQALVSSLQLNGKNIEVLMNYQRDNSKGVVVFERLIISICNAGIVIDDQLINEIRQTRAGILFDLDECVKNLVAFHPDCLTKDKLIYLSKQDASFFLYVKPAIILLGKNGLLNEKTFSLICMRKDLSLFFSTMNILVEINLLNSNLYIVDALLMEKLDNRKFDAVIRGLHKCGILDQDTLTVCYNIILTTSEYTLFKIIQAIGPADFKLAKVDLLTLLQMSENNLKRMLELTENLISCNRLSRETYDQALRRVTRKLPVVTPSSVSKKSRKQTGLKRAELTLDSCDVPLAPFFSGRIFTEHKKINNEYDQGGFGVIKKAYVTVDSDRPICGVKKFFQPVCDQTQHEAQREVKYQRLLGRYSLYFTHKNKINVVTTWLREKNLHSFSKEKQKLLQQPTLTRLRCLISGLVELDILHRHYRIHGDIKPENFIMNFDEEIMQLIDFGGTHKKYSSKKLAYTPDFRDHTLAGELMDSFCDDIYAMGIVVATLFPDIYAVIYDMGRAHLINVKGAHVLPVEQAVINLVYNMTQRSRDWRCTSADAIHYCQQLMIYFYQLDETKLHEITASTIDRSTVTTEDALRDTMRGVRKWKQYL